MKDEVKVNLALVSLLVAALCSLSGCGETITEYRADSTGHLRKIATTVIPHRNDVTYIVNGASFTYSFRGIGGGAAIRGSTVVDLAPGEYRVPFDKMCDGLILETKKTVFSGNIRRLKKASLRTDQLVSEARVGGEIKFLPKEKPPAVEYRSVNGRQWLVTTKFEGPSKRIISSRAWWSVMDGFLVTFNVNFIEAPPDPAWRQQRVQMLERLVSDFRYGPPKT